MKQQAMLVTVEEYVAMIAFAVLFYCVVCGILILATVREKREDDDEKGARQ